MQLYEGAQWARVSGTAAGTTLIKGEPTTLYNIVVGGNTTGTASFYDTAAGTSAATFMVAINTTGGTPGNSFNVGARCKNGLTVVTGGTTDLLVTFQ